MMPNIKSVSDLRNYTEVLEEVDADKRVYLTRNGHGAYAILTMEEADEPDRIKAAYLLMSDLKAAELEAEIAGWIPEEEINKEPGSCS